MHRDYSVYILSDDRGNPRFIAIGQGPCPAIVTWQSRNHSESPLNDWLRTLGNKMPKATIIASRLSQVAAGELFVATRKRLLADGYYLLSTRPENSYVTGGGLAKAVIDENGDLYPSIRDAARSLGLNASTVQRRLKKGKWRYA